MSEIMNRWAHFRVDLNSKSGFGHFARTLPLAEELSQRDWRVTFSNLNVSDDHRLLDLASSSEFISETNDLTPNLVITDSYVRSQEHPQIMSHESVKYVEYVDEITPPREADLYLATSPLLEWKRPLSCAHAPLLTGFQFTQIRNELKVLKSRERVKLTSKSIKKIGVTLGGTELTFELESILNSLNNLLEMFNVIVISNEDLEVAQYKNLNIEVYPKSHVSFERLIECDLVICPSSLSALELIYLEIPIFLIETALNQRLLFDYLSDGKPNNGFSFLLEGTHNLLTKLRLSISNKQSSFLGLKIDGRGSSRLADIIQSQFFA